MSSDPTPETYARWASEADPTCPHCAGLGYAYFMGGLPQAFDPFTLLPMPTKFVGGCQCLEPAHPIPPK